MSGCMERENAELEMYPGLSSEAVCGLGGRLRKGMARSPERKESGAESGVAYADCVGK